MKNLINFKKFTNKSNLYEKNLSDLSDNNEEVELSYMDDNEASVLLSDYVGNDIIFYSDSPSSYGEKIGPLKLINFYIEDDDDDDTFIMLELDDGRSYELDTSKTISAFF